MGNGERMNFLREAISDSANNRASAKRLAMLIATIALAVAVVMLALAAIYGRDVAMALGAVSVPLAGLGGYSYVGGKNAERYKIESNADGGSSIGVGKQ